MMQSNKVIETAYLLRKNKANFNNIVKIDIDKKYITVCNGVKITSNAKKTTPHKLEAQFNTLCQTHLDKKRNGFVSRMKSLK